MGKTPTVANMVIEAAHFARMRKSMKPLFIKQRPGGTGHTLGCDDEEGAQPHFRGWLTGTKLRDLDG